MKKIASLIGVGVLSMSMLVGCNGSEVVETTEVATEVATTEVEEVSNDEVEYKLGVRTDADYVSEWLGLKYTLGSDMVMASDEEIKSMMETGSEILEGEGLADQVIDYAQINTVYEMMAVNPINTSNITVMTEKLPFAGITEEQYIEIVAEQLAAMSIEIGDADVVERDIAGVTFKDVSYSMEVQGMSINQTFLIKKMNDRMVVMTLTYLDDAGYEALLEGFSAL